MLLTYPPNNPEPEPDEISLAVRPAIPRPLRAIGFLELLEELLRSFALDWRQVRANSSSIVDYAFRFLQI